MYKYLGSQYPTLTPWCLYIEFLGRMLMVLIAENSASENTAVHQFLQPLSGFLILCLLTAWDNARHLTGAQNMCAKLSTTIACYGQLSDVQMCRDEGKEYNVNVQDTGPLHSPLVHIFKNKSFKFP